MHNYSREQLTLQMCFCIWQFFYFVFQLYLCSLEYSITFGIQLLFPCFYGLKADLNISYSPVVILTLLESTIYDSNTVALFSYIYHLCDAPVCSILLPNKPVYCYSHRVHWEKYKLVLILVSPYYWDNGHDQWQLGEQRVYFTLKITAYHWRKSDQKLKIGTSDFVLRARYSRFIVICSCASWPSIQPSFLLACLSSVLCPFSLNPTFLLSIISRVRL